MFNFVDFCHDSANHASLILLSLLQKLIFLIVNGLWLINSRLPDFQMKFLRAGQVVNSGRPETKFSLARALGSHLSFDTAKVRNFQGVSKLFAFFGDKTPFSC